MNKSLVMTAVVFALLSGSLSVSDRAQAGASASAPSKYSNANQVAAVHQARIARQSHVAIAEYSSSSARNPSQKHERAIGE